MHHSGKSKMRKWYDAAMLVLCVYVVIMVALEVVVDWPEHTSLVFEHMDLAICLLFLADWFYFLVKADNKARYAKSHVLDLVASIPFAQALRPFRVLRAVRLVRALRIVRGLKGLFPILRVLTKTRARSALLVYSLCTAIIYFYCALGIYSFEKNTNENIVRFRDALWLSFATLTSVGYGDIYPTTDGGRIMAAVLVVVGLGMFSLVTAEFATFFLSYLKQEQNEKGQ